MKHLLLVLSFLCTTFLFSQEWQTSFKKASALSKEKHKPLMLVFSGSDWCAPCIKLDKNIWQSDAFKDYAASHLVLYRADFPRKKSNKLGLEQERTNRELADKYNQHGYFPLVILLDENGKVLGTTGYMTDDPSEFIEEIKLFES